MKPSDMGCLTEEQKQVRDKHIESMHCALFSNYLIEEQQQEMHTIARSARTAYKEPKFDSHQAMLAITVRDNITRDVSNIPWGCPQFCVAAVSQKLLPYNIIAILNI
jgi:hypothetical protein